MGACTNGCVLDFATNDNNVTLSTFSGTGTGTRTLNMGDGTWTITGTTGNVWDITTATNLTLNANASNLTFAATATSNRTMQGGAKAYSTITINDTTLTRFPFVLSIGSAGSVATLALTNLTVLQLPSGSTVVVTNAFSWAGTASAPKSLGVASLSGGTSTLSVGGAVTLSWIAVQGVTKAGAGSISATNAFDLLGNTGFAALTPPSAGGGGPNIIGQ